MLATPLAAVRRQWLLTSRAHRLRKPHRTTQTSDVLCRRTRLGRSAPRSLPLEPDPARGRLRHRGFSTMTTPNPGRLPLLDLRPCDRSRLARAPFNVCARSPRTLFTHRESAQVVSCGPPRQADLGLRHEPRGSFRLPGKMRLPSVCNRLTTRALHGSFGPRITASIGFRR
jgi:hypothetical protein